MITLIILMIPLWFSRYQLSLWGFTLGMGLLHGVCDGFGASKFFRALAELACTVEKVSHQ